MSRVLTDASNLDILYEDNHLIVINKRPGDIVQGDKTGDRPLSHWVKRYIKAKYNKPGAVYLGVVHRIDRPTSGAVIFAKTSKALTRLNGMLKKGEIKKTYWAVVKGCPEPESARLVHWLVKNPKNNKSTAHAHEHPKGKKGILDYRLLKKLERYALLAVNLETGRHHQIRSQLSKIGHPIKGDLKYGYPRSNKNGGIHLHARALEFIHPVKKTAIQIIAPLPGDTVWQACAE